jgi:hypothetical protein
MKKVNTILVFLVIVTAALSAYAGEIAELKKKMIDARQSLYILIDDVTRRGTDQQQQVKNTADAVSAMAAAMKAPAGKEARFKELVTTWKAFNKTREEELVPLILSGKQKEAEKLAMGIQYERFKKMMELCEELEK